MATTPVGYAAVMAANPSEDHLEDHLEDHAFGLELQITELV